jgi:hypothetical protein
MVRDWIWSFIVLSAPWARSLLRYSLFVALVQLLIGGTTAYCLAERWQRWRQRREFQHRTLAKFSELSYEMMDRLSELLVGRGRMPNDLHSAKRRELVSRWTVFVSMRGEVMASYGRQFILQRAYQGVFNTLAVLRGYLNEPERVPQERFEPEQEKYLAYREAVVAHMVRAMGLLSRRDWRAELAASEARIQDAGKPSEQQPTPAPAS